MFRQFVRELCSDWITLVTGIASFILAAIAAIFSATLPAWLFWPAAYVSLIFACYRLWSKERQARTSTEEKLAARSPQAQKETTVRDQIANMTRSELLALKQLVTCGQLTEAELVDFCRRNALELVTPGMLESRVTFLTRDFARGAWSVVPLMDEAVRKVLSETSP
jgi:hypothetical protein